MKIIFEMDEKWKKIKNYPSYKVSNFGKVKRIKGGQGTVTGKILKSQINGSGYWQVTLWKNNKGKSFYIHKLVAEAFLESCPKDKEVNHIDGDKENPYVKNLEYVTVSQNRKHAYRIGLQKGMKGEKNPLNKLKEKDILKIRRLYKTGNYFQRELSKDFNVTVSMISYIVNNKNWKHI